MAFVRSLTILAVMAWNFGPDRLWADDKSCETRLSHRHFEFNHRTFDPEAEYDFPLFLTDEFVQGDRYTLFTTVKKGLEIPNMSVETSTKRVILVRKISDLEVVNQHVAKGILARASDSRTEMAALVVYFKGGQIKSRFLKGNAHPVKGSDIRRHLNKIAGGWFRPEWKNVRRVIVLRNRINEQDRNTIAFHSDREMASDAKLFEEILERTEDRARMRSLVLPIGKNTGLVFEARYQ